MRVHVLMGMYSGFFDESGHEETDAFVMGGLVLDDETIADFNKDWAQAICELPSDRHGNPFLHTTDFINGAEEYRDWKGRYDEKLRILKNVSGVIYRHSVRVFTCVLDMREYSRQDSSYKMSENFGHPYALLVRIAKDQLQGWAHRLDLELAPTMVIEERAGYGEVQELFRADGFPPPSIGGKDIYALQAADYIAFMRRARIKPTSSSQMVSDSWKGICQALYSDIPVGQRELDGFRQRIEEVAKVEVPLRTDQIKVRYHSDPLKKPRRRWKSRTRS